MSFRLCPECGAERTDPGRCLECGRVEPRDAGDFAARMERDVQAMQKPRDAEIAALRAQYLEGNADRDSLTSQLATLKARLGEVERVSEARLNTIDGQLRAENEAVAQLNNCECEVDELNDRLAKALAERDAARTEVAALRESLRIWRAQIIGETTSYDEALIAIVDAAPTPGGSHE